jgi:glycosyltransferase involved in cell wall biosynthesis
MHAGVGLMLMEHQRVSVLHFTNSWVRGGVEQHVVTLLRGLERKFFRLHLVCGPEIAESMRNDLPADVEVLPLALRKPPDLAAAYRLAQMLRERRVDILHSHLFFGSRVASPIGWLCQIPLVIETPHVREGWRHGAFKSKYVVDRCCGWFVDRYIAVSHANAAYLKETKSLPASKVVVVQNGCDVKRFSGSTETDLTLKRSLGFQDDDQVLLVPGRLEPQKGHSVLLRALPEIRREFPAIRVICVGDGALRQQLEAQVSESGLQDSVRFVGFQSNMEDWFALGDITVLPSFFEGLPLVAIESLAACRPVVATAVDGTPEVIVKGKTGITVPPGDPASLAEAILQLLRDPKLRFRLGRQGRQFVLDQFTEEQQIQRTQELYLSALGGRTLNPVWPRSTVSGTPE